MLSTVKSLPWWMIVLTGVLIVAAGIFLLVAEAGLGVMTFLLAVGVLAFGLYNIYKAFRFKDNNDLFVPFLVHGLLNLVLFLLIIVIHDTPALLGVILASWFIIFAVFGIIHALQDKDNTSRTSCNAVMLLIGIA